MNRNLFIFLCVISLSIFGCTAHMVKQIDSSRECIERLDQRMKIAPLQSHLFTLDGQKVPLDEFFQQCLIKMPFCTLPKKFYHWKNEVRSVTSRTPQREVNHKVRIYFNYLSTCDPEKTDPKKTHGDIAEFYDAQGIFMGLIVYTGNGLYCPLPYSKYGGNKEQLRFYMYNF